MPEFLRKDEGEDAATEVMGLDNFKAAMASQQEKNYDDAEQYLKEALKELKLGQQEKSLGYLFLLKRLAYMSFLNKKYTDSEKYFKITANVMPQVTKNPSNIFIT